MVVNNNANSRMNKINEEIAENIGVFVREPIEKLTTPGDERARAIKQYLDTLRCDYSIKIRPKTVDAKYANGRDQQWIAHIQCQLRQLFKPFGWDDKPMKFVMSLRDGDVFKCSDSLTSARLLFLVTTGGVCRVTGQPHIAQVVEGNGESSEGPIDPPTAESSSAAAVKKPLANTKQMVPMVNVKERMPSMPSAPPPSSSQQQYNYHVNSQPTPSRRPQHHSPPRRQHSPPRQRQHSPPRQPYPPYAHNQSPYPYDDRRHTPASRHPRRPQSPDRHREQQKQFIHMRQQADREIDSLRNEINALRDDLRKSQSDAATFKKRWENVRDNASSNYETLEREKKKREEDLAALRQEYEMKLAVLNEDNAALTDELEQLHKQRESEHNQNSDQIEQIETWKELIKTADKVEADSKKKIKSLSKQNKALQAEIRRVRPTAEYQSLDQVFQGFRPDAPDFVPGMGLGLQPEQVDVITLQHKYDELQAKYNVKKEENEKLDRKNKELQELVLNESEIWKACWIDTAMAGCDVSTLIEPSVNLM